MAKFILYLVVEVKETIEKRSKMGEVAFKNSDYTIITDDNPRTEDPSLIRKSIINNNPSY